VGANSSSLTIVSQYPADNNAVFQVVITNVVNSITSAPATLTVLTNVNIPGFPASIVRNVGSYAAFYVTAFGSEPITYQWTQSTDGGNTFTNLPGQTNATLWLSNVQLAQDGNQYTVTVNGPFSSDSAGPATLNVQPRTEFVPLTGYGAIVAADSPVAYWRLDEASGRHGPLRRADRHSENHRSRHRPGKWGDRANSLCPGTEPRQYLVR
jgi:photosystem II stability/assembly factor-like uncharacterized protein